MASIGAYWLHCLLNLCARHTARYCNRQQRGWVEVHLMRAHNFWWTVTTELDWQACRRCKWLIDVREIRKRWVMKDGQGTGKSHLRSWGVRRITSFEVKNEWNHTTILLIYPHGVYRDNFPLLKELWNWLVKWHHKTILKWFYVSGCLRTKCPSDYLDLTGRRWQEAAGKVHDDCGLDRPGIEPRWG